MRDRAGERPLFYARSQNEIIFATEIAALVGHAGFQVTLDQGALRKYLQFGIFPAPDTPFGEIRKVAPGELIQFDKTGMRQKSYWRWEITETAKQSPSLDAFDRTFRSAIGRQSDVDVDFGVFLSGGIDSSLVSAVLRSLHPKRPLKAYTLRFDEQSFDEGRFAAAVARQLKMELVTVQVKPADLRDGLKSLIRMVGEPLADPAWIPTTLLAQRAAQESKMALVGEGADELFGGYPTYIGVEVAERFVQLPSWLRAAIRRVVEALPLSEKKVTISFLLKRFVEGAGWNDMTRHRLWASNITPTLLRRLGVTPIQFERSDAGGGDLLDRAQRWDLETLLAEGLLTKADRASMSSALELRAPFLDEAVMEFAKSLRVEDRVRGLKTKVFLKRYARRYLPNNIVNRRKRGLSVPISSWLRGPLKEWAIATLKKGRLEQVGIHTSAAIELFSEHCQRKADHARAIWTLLVLGEWLDWVATDTDCRQSGPRRQRRSSLIRPANLVERHFHTCLRGFTCSFRQSAVREEVDMKMSGRPPTMFRPEIINQLRVLEFVLHFLRQLRLPNDNKECPCSVSDGITRPERELAFAISVQVARRQTDDLANRTASCWRARGRYRSTGRDEFVGELSVRAAQNPTSPRPGAMGHTSRAVEEKL